MTTSATSSRPQTPGASASWSQYLHTPSPAAFDPIIRQHVNFVYGIARRQVRDPHLAEDVTQAVFLVLARRPHSVKGPAALPGWLFQTTRYCAANAIKIERRRRVHEQAAAAQRQESLMSPANSEALFESDALISQLNDAIAGLNRTDRDVILLRYLQGREMREVGHAMSVSEATARKRVGRAVEKLRQAFANRGLPVASAALIATLGTAGAHAAPPGVAATISSASAGAASPLAGELMRACLRMLLWTNAKLIAGVVATALFLIVSSAAIILHQAAPEPKPTAVAPTTAPAVLRTFTLKIDDKQTVQPLPNTPVVVYLDNNTTTRRTDANGSLIIPQPTRPPMYFGLRVARTGYSPVKVDWQNANSIDPLPATYALHLEKGTSVGGIVRDTAGNPIAGASVFLIIGKASPDGHEQSDIWDAQVRTGADGRWRYDLAPEKPTEISVRLSDPGYVSDDMYGNTARDEKPDDYRSLDRVLVMHKGLAVTGRVTDEAGKPIAGANVKQGDDRWGTSDPATKTNRQGEFKFAQADPGSMTLTVEARGCAPDLKEISVTDDLGLVEFKLQPAQTLLGIVVDPKGNPIDGARVVADTWRGKRTLEWQATTDADGGFEWDDAPADVVTFHVLQQGYMANRSADLTAGNGEQKVTLRPPLTINGTVVDAKTGQLVPAFHLVYGREYRDGDSIYWDHRQDRKFSAGKFSMKFIEPFAKAYLRVEVDGYAPAVSRAFTMTEGMDSPLQLDFKLQPAQSIHVLVLGQDGKPAVGAKVALAVKGNQMRVSDGQFQESQDRKIIIADKDGLISIAPQDENLVVVIMADAGYALLPFEDLSKLGAKPINLLPWVKVDATFKIGSKPFAGQPVSAMSQGSTQVEGVFVSFEGYSNTDAAGRAMFQKMPAGLGWVQDWRMRPNGMWGGEARAEYSATAGETVIVKAGGVGRPVVGRAVVPADFKGKPDWLGGGNGTMEATQQQTAAQQAFAVPYPADWAKMSFGARRAWWQSPIASKLHDEWAKSQQTPSRVPIHEYTALFDGDGKFHINDVPPGSYTLGISLGNAWNNRESSGTPNLWAQKTVQIDPIPGGQTDEPLDVGSLTLGSRESAVPPSQASTAPAPEPGSPADVMLQFDEAMESGDADAAVACIDTSHPLVEAFLRKQARAGAARARAFNAAVASLGADAAKQIPMLGGGQARVRFDRGYAWQINGDLALPTGPTARFDQSMVRLDGHWKINGGEFFVMRPMDPATMNQEIDKWVAKFDGVAAAFKAGTIKTPQQATAMLMKE